MKKTKLTNICSKYIALLLVCLSIIIATGCQKQAQPITHTAYYFDTVIHLTFYNSEDNDLAEECFNLCATYENMLSRTVEGSDIWRINHSNGAPVTVSEETYALLEEALFYCELTEGKIDITIAPLMDLWNFTTAADGQEPPTEDEISALLSHVDYRQVLLGEQNTVTLKDPEAAIDLGFIAKGYIADKLKEYLVSQGVTSALINLGGNVCVIGSKPDGSPYTVGIQKPFSPAGTTLDVLQVKDSSVVTSGTYERYFIYEDKTYHHILDATTGYPIENNLTGVTILCDSSTQADALSTTCFVLGLEDAQEYISTLNDTECILIDSSEHITYSYK
ncbi:MAG: FAD:protein FMN transferase [Lachnospiraceae bacterium]|nr:FAD:protein FMN transferase [Lachnospiraceae bacterium]